MATTTVQPVAVPVGRINSFGPWGPEYEVLGPADPDPVNGEARVHIVLVRTGEETTYGFDAMMEDPEAK